MGPVYRFYLLLVTYILCLPEVSNKDWSENPIDNFILARLEREGSQPSPPAGKETLIRQLSFDLTGLPPSLDEIDTFLADSSDTAYEKTVDHKKLTFKHQGRRFRLTDVHGHVIKNILT